MEKVEHVLGYLGYQVSAIFAGFGNILRFVADTAISFTETRRENLSAFSIVIVDQVYFTGLQAMPILTAIALLVGSLVCFQSLPYLIEMGAGEFIGIIFVVSIVRELGPLFTAIVVICRSGAAICAELSTNKVNMEVEALEAMGINLYQFIVIPRLLGMVISVFALTIYFNLVALFGGFLVGSGSLGMEFGSYVRHIITALEFKDVYVGLLKGVAFGLLVSILCTYYGLKTGRASTEVPQVVTRGVSRSVLLIIVLNFIISAAFYR